MHLRPATLEDAGILLEWRNHPRTRQACSADQSLVTMERHQAWLEQRLSNDLDRLWIAEDGGVPFGTCRVACFYVGDASHGEVSITVDPNRQGMGYGKIMLGALIDAVRADHVAQVLEANILDRNCASVRLFLGAGFKPVGTATKIGQRRYQLYLGKPA